MTASDRLLEKRLSQSLDEIIQDEKRTGPNKTKKRFSPQRKEATKPYKLKKQGFKQNSSSGSTRVFVGNLAYSVAWQNLKDIMKEHIAVPAFVEVFTDEQGRSKGCGIIEFENARDAHRAISQLQDYVIDGRPIFLREVV
jgi:RNA recognition motif-containing protein